MCSAPTSVRAAAAGFRAGGAGLQREAPAALPATRCCSAHACPCVIPRGLPCACLLAARPLAGSTQSMTLMEMEEKGYRRLPVGEAEQLWRFWFDWTQNRCFHGG